jgi:Protein of unknown function (DUF4232)
MRLRLSVLSATAASVCALAVGACGGSSNTSDQTRTIVETRTVTQPVTSPTGNTSTGPLTNTTATSKTTTQISDACNASDLTPVYLGSNGAAGTIVLGFGLKNTGSTTCHTYGWPGVQFLSSSGAALPTGSVRTTGDVVGSTPAIALTLAPGGAASFRMVTSDMGPNGSSCPTASELQIYAPDDTVKMKVSVSGVAACGKATLSPLMPGTSAFAGQGGGAGQTGLSGSGGSSTTNGGSGLSNG